IFTVILKRASLGLLIFLIYSGIANFILNFMQFGYIIPINSNLTTAIIFGSIVGFIQHTVLQIRNK
ncbi:MAG: hypothetical protein KKI14_02200, partial [Nanoarchaeota archaeon]|nr:hypothetical protein [Nanoarchaeota archaeon]